MNANLQKLSPHPFFFTNEPINLSSVESDYFFDAEENFKREDTQMVLPVSGTVCGHQAVVPQRQLY